MSFRKSNTERFVSKINYGLYCINLFGSGLNTIRDEFKRQVQTGVRQSLFIVDLAEIQQELNNLPRKSKLSKELKKNYNNLLINIILQKVQGFSKEYEQNKRKIKEELSFDLYQHWLQNLEQTPEKSLEISEKKLNNKSKDSKESKRANEIKFEKANENQVACISSLIAREHNIVDQTEKLSKRKFIKDEPTLGKLFIIILGQISADFYTDLLRHHLNLEGILNFIPSESNYDIMLGNNKIRNFIEETLNTINYSVFYLRQQIPLKSVGLFTHNLPVISICMAKKMSREIYDQLTWSIYDIEILKQQYEQYYFKPFQLTNVDIPKTDNLTEMYYKVESLSIKGDFQDTVIPSSGSDLVVIAIYLNSLIRSCEILSENFKEGILADSNYKHHSVNNGKELFSSITKILRYDKLIVDGNNKLLLNMLKYCDCNQGRSIYLCSLDYNVLKRFSLKSLNAIKSNSESNKKIYLPQYAKYYPNEECSQQRLMELLNQYEYHQVQEIANNCKLYSFKRFYNILQEDEGTIIIPTRLCFRDFTLFQMEEFLQNLRIPKSNPDSNSKEALNDSKITILDLDDNFFIRPNSLKALKLLEERKSKESSKRKTGSLSSRSKNEKKSSLSKSFNKNEDVWGLPPDHSLLKGYNLEDTLQEIKYKTSNYYYTQGFVKLYEEKWCFQEMNKQLTWCIHNSSIFFNRPRYKMDGLSNNIRLLTENNVSLRILNGTKECSKIVINYPNGLTVFYNDSYCEQIWYKEHTLREEKRRIYTPYGAVIVFFKNNDLILIMRYNGEVYRLYQNDLLEEEEEQGFTSDFQDIQEKSSGYIDTKRQEDIKLLNEQRKRKITIDSDSKSKKSRMFKNQKSEESIKISLKSTTIINNLKSSVSFELNFFNFLSSLYGLQYMYIIITTAQGKRIKLTQQGEIFEVKPCLIREWHDYFVNESYCERSDGVKMIWTENSLKCFHEDGTVFQTLVEEDISSTDGKDEFESQISQSSSHNDFQQAWEEEKLNHEIDNLKSVKSISTINNSLYTFTEATEEFTTSDYRFLCYVSRSWFMQHPSYASVYILNTNLPYMPICMELFGLDIIRIYCHKELANETDINDADYMGFENVESEQFESNFTTIVNVWIGDNLNIRFDQDTCEINAVLSQDMKEKEKKEESLTLRLKYTDCINEVFKYLIKQIASFENNIKKKRKIIYFMEKNNKNGTKRGFEFCNQLPLLSQNNYHAGNNIIELNPLKSLDESMRNDNTNFEQDLQKFPRSKPREKKKLDNSQSLILSANLFLEIPKQLRNTDNITKFLEPFENIGFKKLRSKFKNVLNSHLKLQQLIVMKTYSSSKIWKKRQWEHERRLFNEQQRLGLYQAMNKFKIYPGYWNFTKTYKGDVKHIEFFNFIKDKCNKKA